MEKLPHYHFSWIVSFQKQIYHVCEFLGDRRGYSHLKEEAVDRIKWRNRFGGGCGPVVWQITDDTVTSTFVGVTCINESIINARYGTHNEVNTLLSFSGHSVHLNNTKDSVVGDIKSCETVLDCKAG
jgi:hypothetical protein